MLDESWTLGSGEGEGGGGGGEGGGGGGTEAVSASHCRL